MKAANISTKLVFAAAMLLLPRMADAQDVLRGQAMAERWSFVRRRKRRFYARSRLPGN